MGVKGYKAFDHNMQCRGFQYELGEIYEHAGKIELCEEGFHFCEKIVDCFRYYGQPDARFAEVEALGNVKRDEDGDSKCVTDKIRIIREIPRQEAVDMTNTGNCNTGDRNTGNRNTGHSNTGDRNTGNRNTGDRNTGDRNTGDRNTGDWNTADFSTGCFNTLTQKIFLFDKPSPWTYEDFRDSAAYSILRTMPWDGDVVNWTASEGMTEEEKQEHPEHETTGGYLKVTPYKADKQKWWDELSKADKAEVMSLPNFDADIFKECTGIEVNHE